MTVIETSVSYGTRLGEIELDLFDIYFYATRDDAVVPVSHMLLETNLRHS